MAKVDPVMLHRARELRQPQTPAEERLWSCLRDSQLEGLKFRRQHPIGPFIVDFYCAQKRLVIEVDGDSHFTDEQMEYDRARTAWLEEQGCKVIRFTNTDVMDSLDEVLVEIIEA
jgi:very-short-patch-repair endonuclease